MRDTERQRQSQRHTQTQTGDLRVNQSQRQSETVSTSISSGSVCLQDLSNDFQVARPSCWINQRTSLGTRREKRVSLDPQFMSEAQSWQWRKEIRAAPLQLRPQCCLEKRISGRAELAASHKPYPRRIIHRPAALVCWPWFAWPTPSESLGRGLSASALN
eukprot:3564827-Rhodomonas_salina.2